MNEILYKAVIHGKLVKIIDSRDGLVHIEYLKTGYRKWYKESEFDEKFNPVTESC